jgi:hypothetical protein
VEAMFRIFENLIQCCYLWVPPILIAGSTDFPINRTLIKEDAKLVFLIIQHTLSIEASTQK